MGQRATLPPDTSHLKTFADHKKILNDYYNWNVVFPATTIHTNSILYRDAEQKESYREELKRMSEKVMTMGSHGYLLKSEFGGSNKELSPRKVNMHKSLLYDSNITKSEISLNQMKSEEARNSSTLLNMIGIPFNWKSRMLTRKNSDRNNKKKPNMLTNFWKKKRNGVGYACNKR